MSAPAWEVSGVEAARDDYDHILAGRGHAMRWRLGENACKAGHAYFWVGRCGHCAAEMSIGSGWSSCAGVRDARYQPCSGPGTAMLAEIEAAHVAGLFAAVVDEFLWEIQP